MDAYELLKRTLSVNTNPCREQNVVKEIGEAIEEMGIEYWAGIHHGRYFYGRKSVWRV